ncbi:MAG: LamG-like jellyroll fold domain-containing protein, partial [Bacteroidota bacterium]
MIAALAFLSIPAFAQPTAPTVSAAQGTTVCSGGATTLTASGSVASTAGKALQMATAGAASNTGNYLSYGTGMITSASTGFTAEGWFYPTSYVGVSYVRAFTFGIPRADNLDRMELFIDNATTDGQIYFEVYTPTGTPAANGMAVSRNVPGLTSVKVPLNAWIHLTLAVGTDSTVIYVNGVYAASRAGFNVGALGNITRSNTGFSNYFTDTQTGFKGNVDEVRFWNYRRSNAEVLANYKKTLAPNSTGLLANYHFDQSSGSTVANAVTNTTAVGAATIVNTTGTGFVASTISGYSNPYPTYNWSPSTGLSATTGTSVTASPTSNTTYSATADDGNGVSSAAGTIAITASATAAPTITPSSYTACASQVVLTASGSGPWLWSANAGSATTQSVTVTSSGNYYVTTGSCASTVVPVTLTTSNVTVPTIAVTGSGTTFCTGTGTTTLTASALSAGVGGSAGNMLFFANPGQATTTTNNDVSLPTTFHNNFTSAFTFEGYIRPSTLSHYQNVITLGTSNDQLLTNGKYLVLRINTDGSVHMLDRVSGAGNATDITLAAAGTIVSGTMYHMALTLDGANMKLYINGNTTPVYNAAFTKLPNQTNGLTNGLNSLGRSLYNYNDGEFNYQGYMDEVRFWTSARTASEINANYNKVVAVPASGLIAYYRFDKPTSTTSASTNARVVISETGSNDGTMNTVFYNASNTNPYVASSVAGFENITYVWSTPSNSSLATTAAITVSPT